MNVEKTEELALGGFRVLNTTGEALCRTIASRQNSGVATALVFANTNFVVRCRHIRPRLNERSIVIANDGLGMDLAAIAIHGKRFRQNLNGTDFVPYFFQNAARRQRVFLVGGKPGVAEAAAKVVEARFDQKVVGCADGYAGLKDPLLVERISAARADVVLVAMGNPTQEEWIVRHLPRLNPALLIGVGALLDFLANRKRRAPRWIRSLRCEWLYRLGCEPIRLFRRYTLDVGIFFARCARRRQETVGMILGTEPEVVADTGTYRAVTLPEEELVRLPVHDSNRRP